MTHADRFDGVRKHKSYSEHNSFTPRLGLATTYMPGLFAIGVGAGFYLFTSQMFTGDFPGQAFKLMFAVIPGLIVLFGIYALFRAYQLAKAPWRRRIAVVVDERTEVTTQNDRARTQHFCTLQWEDGDRTEMKTKSKVAGIATRGDIGIVYTKLDQLIDFRRVDV